MPIRLPLKVIPGARRDQVEWFGDGFKVKVRTAPEKGRANKAVEHLLASTLGLPVANVLIVSGHTGRNKVVQIEGMDVDTLRRTIDRMFNGQGIESAKMRKK